MTSTAPLRLSRRRFLAGAATTAAAGAVLPTLSPRYAFASPEDPASGDTLVAIFLRGGADGLSLVPPFSDTAGYQNLRGAGTSNDVAVPPPNAADPANTAIDLGLVKSGHHFGLHPAATGLKSIWDAGHLAIVHAVGLPAGESDTRSHFDAETYWERASANVGIESGWIGRHLATSGPWDGVPAIGYDTGGVPMSLRGEPRAMGMSSIEGFHVEGFSDSEMSQAALSALYPDASGDVLTQQGHDTLAAVDQVVAADPAQYDDNAALYPTERPAGDLSRGLREIAQIMRAGIGLRVACLDLGGWDVHDDMGPVSSAGGTQRLLTQALSDSLWAFHQDLGPLMNEVTVVTMTEFGRTIACNGSGGTDHGRGTALFVMSGHAQQGIHGDYPTGPLSDGPEYDLVVANDYRTVMAEVLTKRLGNPHVAEVFPGYTHPGDLGVVA
jgi:uncharacterized protein (DUF1501 family)